MSHIKIRSFLVAIIALVIVFGSVPLSGVSFANTTGIIKRVYTDKARYNPEDVATIKVEMTNDSGSAFNGSVAMTIHHLETQVHSASQTISLSNGASTTVTFTWTTPETDFKGYFVNVTAGTATGATAIDVSSTWTRFPRYGYMTEFPVGESSATTDAKIKQTIEDYHTNAFQMYDWMWRHENMIKRTGGQIDSSWTDWSGKHTMSWQTIQNMISSIHNYNAAAMPYTMSYAALADYEQLSNVNPQWGMFTDTQHQYQDGFDFGDDIPSTWLWLFNPADTNWQNHIFGQYRDILSTAGFDGIHLDQMGQRPNVYTYGGTSIDLPNTFRPFINNLRNDLNNNGFSNKVLTFNNVDGAVDGWAFNDVTTNANYDFSFAEIWGGADEYIELKDTIAQGRRNNGQKAMVLAAYMNFDNNTGIRYEAENANIRVGVNTATNHSGYTGSGFVDGFGDVGDYVQWTISIPETGWYPLVFGYCTNIPGGASRNLYVDGNFVKKIDNFKTRSSWTDWSFDPYALVYLTAGSHTVKLAMDSDNSNFINLDSLTVGMFDEPSVRLGKAAIAASGSFQIDMGEGDLMLGHPYYPNRSKRMNNSLKTATKNFYNFITAYENLLFDKDVIPSANVDQVASVSSYSVSGKAENGNIWAQVKHGNDYTVAHLINLTQSSNKYWRDADSEPNTITDKTTKIYVGNPETISGVYLASPDINLGASQSLSFSTGTDSVGKYVSFTMPSLKYWNMIYMKRSSFAVPANDIYEAELGLKANVTTNNNWSGYTGTGFIDNFNGTGESVTFVVNADTTKDYNLKFRYSNNDANATRNIYVDGVLAGTLSMDVTGGWGTWGTAQLTANLKQGVHSITIMQDAQNLKAVNLDHLDLD